MKAAAAVDKELTSEASTRTGVSVKFSESKNRKVGCVAEHQWDPQGQQMHTIEGDFTDGYGLLRHSNIWGKDKGIRWAWTELNVPVDLSDR